MLGPSHAVGGSANPTVLLVAILWGDRALSDFSCILLSVILVVFSKAYKYNDKKQNMN